MHNSTQNRPINSIVAYTPYPWEHALNVLRISGPLNLADINLIRGHDDPERVLLGDAVLIQRDFPRFLDQFEKIINIAREKGKPVIYEIDDLLFELPEDHPYRRLHYFTPALLPMLRAVIEADVVTTTTPLLQSCLLPFNPNTWILPNYLDDRLWTNHSLQTKRAQSPIIVGYMGSDSHLTDLETITPVFLNLLERYGDRIIIKFWGGPPPSAILNCHNVEWVPLELTNYSEFVEYFSQQEIDLFIAPLADLLFNRCKSAIKFLEYSSLGVPGVYSRLAPYEAVVDHGTNGFLAYSLEDWENHLVQLIESPSLRHEMGEKAKETVQEKWLLSKHAYKWGEVYHKAMGISSEVRPKQIVQERENFILGIAEQVQALQRILQGRLEKEEQYVRELSAHLEKKEGYVRELSAQLEEITGSEAWRLGQRCWSIRLKLAPQGSFREGFVRRVFKFLKNIRWKG